MAFIHFVYVLVALIGHLVLTKTDDNCCGKQGAYRYKGFCIPCPEGERGYNRCSNDKICFRCPRGFYASETSNTKCTPCQKGKIAPNIRSGDCQECGPGRYQDKVGQSACEICEEGKFSTEDENEECFLCPRGRFMPFKNAPECFNCTQGKFANEIGSTKCVDCAAGKWSDEAGAKSSDACKACPAGTFSASASASSEDACTKCPAGTWSASASADKATTCISCPTGKYSSVVGATAEATCNDCPSGTYSESTGATSEDTCTPCAAGTWSKAVGANSPSTCLTCPPGTWSSKVGASDDSLCTPCVQGTYSSTAGAHSSSICNKCPLGRYNPEMRATNNSACLACKKGFYTLSEGASRCSPCSPGRYNPDRGGESFAMCLLCTPGRFMRDSGSSICDGCPAGKASAAIGAANDSVCKECGVGKYSETPSGGSACLFCPAGTFGLLPGSSHVRNCTECPAGKASAAVGAANDSVCKECEAGSYAIAGSPVCVRCPLNAGGNRTTTLAGKGYSRSSCYRHCPKGQRSLSSVDTCFDCDPGSFQDKEGQDVCSTCPRGRYQLNKRATGCDLCRPGTYSESVGSPLCSLCPGGKFSTIPASMSSTNCLPCLPGQWSIPGVTQCSLVPPGTWTNASSRKDDFIPCPAGTFQTQLGQSSCNTTRPGYYSGYGSAVQLPCKAGTYTANWGSSSPSACLPCPVGTSSPAAADSCSPCHTGTFSAIPGQSQCERCALGTFSPLHGSSTCSLCPIGTYSPNHGSSACLICDYHSIAPKIGAFNCTTCGSNYIGDANRTTCIPDPNAFTGLSLVSLLYSKGVAITCSLSIASVYVGLAVTLQLKRKQMQETIVQLSWIKVLIGSFLPGYSFGSELFIIMSLFAENNDTYCLGAIMVLLRLLHLLTSSIVLVSLFGPPWLVDILSKTSFGRDLPNLLGLMDNDFALANTAPLSVLAILSLFDANYTIFLPWKNTIMSKASDGYPTLTYMKVVLGTKLLQSTLSVACLTIFLTMTESAAVSDPTASIQAKFLSASNIVASGISILIGLILWCIKGSLLVKLEQEMDEAAHDRKEKCERGEISSAETGLRDDNIGTIVASHVTFSDNPSHTADRLSFSSLYESRNDFSGERESSTENPMHTPQIGATRATVLPGHTSSLITIENVQEGDPCQLGQLTLHERSEDDHNDGL